MKATCCPFGDTTGDTMPSARRGARESTSRTRFTYSAGDTRSVAEKGIVREVVPATVRRRITPSDTYTISPGPAQPARKANTFSLPVNTRPLTSYWLAPVELLCTTMVPAGPHDGAS